MWDRCTNPNTSAAPKSTKGVFSLMQGFFPYTVQLKYKGIETPQVTILSPPTVW